MVLSTFLFYILKLSQMKYKTLLTQHSENILDLFVGSTFDSHTEWNVVKKRLICDENLTNNIHLLILKLMSWKYIIVSPEPSGFWIENTHQYVVPVISKLGENNTSLK